VHGSTVMKIRSEVTHESGRKWNIIIFEENGRYVMERPVKFDPERLVLSLSMLIVLMYAISLATQPSFKLNIHNKCLNVDLISPKYATSDELECHRPSGHKVCSGDTMRSGFIIKSDNESFGVLTYRLKKRQTRESTGINRHTASVSQILVVWRISKSKEIYVDVLLVEHGEWFDCNKDKLRRLYQKYWHPLNAWVNPIESSWLLDNTTALRTTVKAMNGNHGWDIFISEEMGNNVRRPLWINAEV
jgi:hypothetical protein